MRKLIGTKAVSAAVLTLSVTLAGCPYDSPSPVADASSAALDQGLIGKWRCIGGDDEKGGTITISRTTPTEFALVSQSGSEDAERYRLHSAKSGNVQLVNIEATKAGENRPWLLGRLTLLRPAVLHVEVADEEPFKAAPALRPADVVAQSLKRGDLFHDALVCARATDGR
jgi:hypothetical protein